MSWLWLNNRSGPTANKKFRQAVMFAIDRNFAKDVIWNGLGKVATGPSSSSIKYYTDAVTKYDFDPAKAKALLKEAGYNGEKVRLLPLPYGETWQRWAEAVKQNLQDVGINVEMIATDVPGWNQKTADWDYDIAFTYLYQYGDPALGVGRNYVSSQISKGSPFNNVEGYSNPEIDQLFADGAVAFPDSQAQGNLRQGAEDPDRRRAGGMAARTAVPHHHPLQRQEPRHDRDRRQRRLPRCLDRKVGR